MLYIIAYEIYEFSLVLIATIILIAGLALFLLSLAVAMQEIFKKAKKQ